MASRPGDTYEEAHQRAARGDFAAIDALAPDSPGWRLAFASVRYAAAPSGPPPWRAGAIEDSDPAFALVAEEAIRHAFLADDVAALEHWATRVTGTRRPIAELWRAAATGAFDDVAALAPDVESAAARAGLGAIVVDAAALRALALLAIGEVDGAVSTSRRASRMARTEGFFSSEYLAHLVLARVRRAVGHPHLATRILEALARVAPPTWRPWLCVELALSGALEIAKRLELGVDTISARWGSALVALLDAAERADRETFGAQEALLKTLGGWAPFDRELDELVRVLDPERQPGPVCDAWCRGATDDVPGTLAGLLTRPGSAPAEDSALAYVVARPSDRRRLPRLAFGLTDRLGLTALPQSRRKQGRVEVLVSLLLLAPDGVDETECFARIYGFSYEVEIHKGVFDVLIHRAREYVQDTARIVREDGLIRIELVRSLLVADPRCTPSLPDSLLRIVAQHRGATAKQIAEAAGVSLRAAQAALRDLTEAGACETQRSGRQIQYVVEDTTFSEPTGRDLRPTE